MRRRAVIIAVVSVLALAAPLILALPLPSLSGPTQTTPATLLRVEAGDRITLKVAGYASNGTAMYAPTQPVVLTENSSPTLPGLQREFFNASEGTALTNVSLNASDGLGAFDWGNVYNLSRIDSFPRVETVSLIAVERAVRRAVQVGDVLPLPEWNVTVTDIQNGEATLRGDPVNGSDVHYYTFWLSRVIVVNATTIVVRHDPTLGEAVVAGDANQPFTGRVSGVNATNLTVDFNPPLAGLSLTFTAKLISIAKSPDSGQVKAMIATAAGQQACEQCHGTAGFHAFTASVATTPTARGTYVNVTVTDAWYHQVTGTKVAVSGGRLLDRASNLTASLAAIASGADGNTSLLVHPGAKAPANLTITATAHFSHGRGGIPDDLPYTLTVPLDLAKRRAATASVVALPARGPNWDLVGRVTGWLAVPLMLYPAYQGWSVRRRRQHRLAKPSLTWPAWMNLHILPSIIAVVVSFAHAGVLMATDFRGQNGLGIWTGYIALGALGVLGASGLVMAKWAPYAWKKARKWHAGITLVALIGGLVHALLIGTTFAFLR
ncbi:MAG: hypothetical protein ACYDCK_02200 [Thermoplasmatota archaeon]